MKIKTLSFIAILILLSIRNILYPLSLKINDNGNARFKIAPIARLIRCQSIIFSDLVASRLEPDVLFSFGMPSVILQNGEKVINGYPTFTGSLDLSLHINIGIAFFSGKFYDDYINIINPRITVNISNGLVSDSFIMINFMRLTGPEDFSFYSRDVSFIKKLEIKRYQLFWGASLGELDCKNKKLKPLAFKETVFNFHSGVLVSLTGYLFTGLECKIGKDLILFGLNFIIRI